MKIHEGCPKQSATGSHISIEESSAASMANLQRHGVHVFGLKRADSFVNLQYWSFHSVIMSYHNYVICYQSLQNLEPKSSAVVNMELWKAAFIDTTRFEDFRVVVFRTH